MFEIFADEMKYIEQPEDVSYSLFFIHNNNLYEYRTTTGELNHINTFCSQSDARQRIFDLLILKNESGFNYLSDITIFSEETLEEVQKKNSSQEDNSITNKSEGFLIIILISLIFFINFRIANPENLFFEFTTFTSQLMEQDPDGGDLLNGIQTTQDLKSYFFRHVFENVYNINFREKNIDLSQPSASDLKKSPNLRNMSIHLESQTYRPSTNTIISGLNINFNIAKEIEKQTLDNKTEKIRNFNLNYDGEVAIDFVEDFSWFNFNWNENSALDPCYSVYLKPSLGMRHLEYFRAELNEIFNKNLYRISLSIVFYNYIEKSTMMHQLVFNINSVGQITYEKYLQGYQPFLSKELVDFILILGMNLLKKGKQDLVETSQSSHQELRCQLGQYYY